MTAKQKEVTFGWELILNLYECDIESMSSKKKIEQFSKELCDLIEMVPYGKPLVPYFGHNKPHTKGYSLVQLIETSSITGHFSEYKKSIYLNIFSCKPYDHKKAKAFAKKFFGAKRVKSHYITRI